MAKDQNTFAKRMREMQKKRKAEEKRARRQRKKEVDPEGVSASEAESPPVEEEASLPASTSTFGALR
jgi:hypothetical protein